jgi:mannose-6-phosphate isomerase-like protein (cupin superfamily)
MSLSIDELGRLATALARSPERWGHLVRHAEDARVYEQIWDDEDVNAWVICWSEDQDTGFHDHDESAAAIAVVSGHVREDRLVLSGAPVSREFGPGATFTLAPVAIHRVLHAGTGPAVTIHCYSPPLRRTGAYRTAADGTLERESQSFAVELGAELTAV